MMRNSLLTSLSLLAGLGAAASSLSGQVTFTDNFSGPEFGPDWVQYNNPDGGWQIEDHQAAGMSGPVTIARPILGTNPPPEGYTLDKVLSYEGFSLNEPFSLSADMVGLSANKWAGLAFNIQGDPAADANKVSYYSLIIRTEKTGQDSAIQFRYYDQGANNVLRTIHPIPDGQGGTHQIEIDQYYRYTVSSEDPGVFLFSIDKIDNETRDVIGNIASFSESHSALSGGFAGLHSNSNNVGYSDFEVSAIPEPATVALWMSGAALLFVAIRRRFRS